MNNHCDVYGDKLCELEEPIVSPSTYIIIRGYVDENKIEDRCRLCNECITLLVGGDDDI